MINGNRSGFILLDTFATFSFITSTFYIHNTIYQVSCSNQLNCRVRSWRYHDTRLSDTMRSYRYHTIMSIMLIMSISTGKLSSNTKNNKILHTNLTHGNHVLIEAAAHYLYYFFILGIFSQFTWLQQWSTMCWTHTGWTKNAKMTKSATSQKWLNVIHNVCLHIF